MAQRNLVVKVIKGTGLKNKETFQTSDPYCSVEVGDQKQKTKKVSSNLNPVWEEEFTFDLSSTTNGDVISLSVWDKNTIKKDVFMGYTFVTFDDCKTGQETIKTVNMMGGMTGQITLSLKPDFETLASKIDRLDKVVEQKSNDDGKLKKEVEDLNKKVSQLSTDNAKLKSEKEASEKKPDEKKDDSSASSELQKEIERLKGERTTLENRVAQLETELLNARSQCKNYNDVFARLVAETQKLTSVKEGLNALLIK